MEPQIDFEGIHMIWALAFLLDIVNASLLFVSIFRRINRPGFEPVMAWLAWWFCVDAITLIINEVLGPMNPFSYHQIGIVTGIALFSGFTANMIILFHKNWWMNETDWEAVDKAVKDSQLRRKLLEAGVDPSILEKHNHGVSKEKI